MFIYFMGRPEYAAFDVHVFQKRELTSIKISPACYFRKAIEVVELRTLLLYIPITLAHYLWLCCVWTNPSQEHSDDAPVYTDCCISFVDKRCHATRVIGTQSASFGIRWLHILATSSAEKKMIKPSLFDVLSCIQIQRMLHTHTAYVIYTYSVCYIHIQCICIDYT